MVIPVDAIEDGRIIPAITSSGKREQFHNGILMVVELRRGGLTDDGRLDSLALDLIHEGECEVDLRLNGRHQRAVGDGSIRANHHWT